MSNAFLLRLYAGDTFISETACVSLSIEKEAYTPYNEMTAVFLSDGADYGNVNRVALIWNDSQIFLGLADSVTQFRKNGCCFIRVHSKSFTSMMAQNEMEKELIANLTITELVNHYYQIPFVTCEEHPGMNYIYVKDGTTLWDCIVSFGFKLTHHYPYVNDNHICLSPPVSSVLHTIRADSVLEYGSASDTSKLVSHYHMEDMQGNPDAFSQTNDVAVNANIIRHKQIAFDRQFLRMPMEALMFRNLFSQRGWKSRYVVYQGFADEKLGDKITFGSFMQEMTVCRVQFSFGQNGMRTKIWAYQDGFYNN